MSHFTNQAVITMLDNQLQGAFFNARRVADARASRTGNHALRFDSIDQRGQNRLLNQVLTASHAEYLAPPKLRADAIRYRERFFAGELGGFAKGMEKVRADAAGSVGSGGADLHTVHSYSELVEGLTAPLQGSSFVPQRADMSMGAQAVLHRRIYAAGEHLPISADGEGMGSLDYTVESGLTRMHWYGSMGRHTVMQQMDGDFQGVSPSAAIDMSARIVVAQATDRICWQGDATTGLTGIIGASGVNAYPGTAIIVGATLDLSDVDAVVEAIVAQVGIIERQSKQAMSPNVIGVSSRIMATLRKPRAGVSQLGIESLMASLQAGRSDRTYRVESTWRLDASGPSGQDGVLFMDDRYGKDGMHQIVIGPLVIPVSNGIETRLYVVTKQGGIAQAREHAALVGWYPITGV